MVPDSTLPYTNYFPSSFYTSKMGILIPPAGSLLGILAVFKNSKKDYPSYQEQIPGSTLPEIFYPSKALIGIKGTFSYPHYSFNQGDTFLTI